MKKLIYGLLMMLIPALMFTACKKEAGSNMMVLLGLGGGGVPAVQGVFTKEVIGSNGASTASSIWGTTAESRYMMLFPFGDIRGSGLINSISFKYNAAPGEDKTFAGVTIKMGHTSVTTLSSTYLNNVETLGGGKGSFTTVLNNQSVTIPNGTAGTYFTIQLPQPFYYNGVDNLVVEVTRNAVLPTAGGVVLTTHTEDGVNNYTVNGSGAGTDTAPTGATAYTYPDVKFNFAGGDDRLHYGTTGNSLPFWGDPNYQRAQMLYKHGDINGSGGITGICFTIASANIATQEYTVTVRLGHTTLEELVSSSWDANFNSGSPVTVANAVSFKVPASLPVGTYVWLPLTGSFNYNGTSNLIVDITVTSSVSMTAMQIDSSGLNTRLVGSSTTPATISPLDNTRYNIKFRFKGSTADVITLGGDTDFYPFNDTFNNKTQYLYLPNELGTSGTVTSLAFRLKNASVTTAFNSFTVVMGHTTNATLGTAYATNMVDATTVYSATFTVPSGLKTGDWIEIPLSQPFNYDITKNLVVQMSALSGSAAHGIASQFNDMLYLNRHSYAPDNTAVNATGINNYLADIRLKIE